MPFIPDTLDEALERAEGYAKREYSGPPHPLNAAVLVAVIRELIALRSNTLQSGAVPDREAFWLVERTTVSPPQYVSMSSSGWHSDVWRARRFRNEREAHDYWRMMGETDRQQFKVVEHLFINKP